MDDRLIVILTVGKSSPPPAQKLPSRTVALHVSPYLPYEVPIRDQRDSKAPRSSNFAETSLVVTSLKSGNLFCKSAKPFLAERLSQGVGVTVRVLVVTVCMLRPCLTMARCRKLSPRVARCLGQSTNDKALLFSCTLRSVFFVFSRHLDRAYKANQLREGAKRSYAR